MTSTWLKRVFEPSRPAPSGRGTRRPHRRTVRPALEALEERAVPTVFNVTTTADVLGGPALSLRQALLNANLTAGPHTINLTVPGIYQLTRFGNAHDGTNGALQATNPRLTINGLGAAATVIDGGGVDRVFDVERVGLPVAGALSVTFSGLTIQHGLASSNGNKGGDANGNAAAGAGIYSPQVDLVLAGTVVANNLSGDFGGGIWTDTGTVTITGGAVRDNGAANAGGGLYTRSGAITLTNVTFADNLADSNGGALAIGDAASAGNLTVVGCTFAGNIADNKGGAIFDFSTVHTVSITGTTITGNTADGSGGGLHVAAATLTIDRSTISDNTAATNGGGIYANDNPNQVLTTTNSVIDGNTADGDGGGIDSNAASATFTSDLFAGNVAENGAGIAFFGAQLTLADSHVDGNRAENVDGGLELSGRAGGSGTITDSTLDNNRAASDNGGGSLECATLTVRNSSINGNRTGGSTGGLLVSVTTATFTNVNVIGNVAGSTQGGLDLGAVTLTMTGCNISNNRSASSVGGLFVDGTATISNTVISGNRAGGDEGGLNFRGTQLNLLGDTITNNTAAFDEGGVFLFISNGGTISNSTVSGNRAAGSAGGIEADVTGGTLTISGCTFSDNHAGLDGGGLLADGVGTVTLTNVTLFGNTASVYGGGIAHEGTGTLNLVNATIDGNAAANGGGVFSNQPTVKVLNTIIAGNAANAGKGPDVNGVFTSQGFNLIGVQDAASTSFLTGMTTDQVGSAAAPVNPRLGPLQNNGGPTFTQALLPGSPAIGRADGTRGPATDQRGQSRPATPSIGAFEPRLVAAASANLVLVESFYEALLGRPADPGSAAFVNELNAGMAPVMVVLQLEGSLEYRADQVQALYQRYLHRGADAGGLQGFAAFLGAGGTLEQVADMLAGSPEYFALHGASNEAFLGALYEDALGRQADAGGLAAFGQALAGGLTRGQAAALIFSSAEYQADLVQADYEALLGRPADPVGLAVFGGELQRGGSDQLVLAQILGSGEAFARRV